MMVLGIETSTAVCSVGLATESAPLGETSLVESHIHSEKLLTLIQKLCHEHSVTLPQLDGIAVSLGPGSFTGLRIGLSTAKGLGYALGKPLVAVSTFEAIAYRVFGMHPGSRNAVVCIDAKQGEHYIGMYEKKNGTFDEILPVHVGSIASIVNFVNEGTVVVTDQQEVLKREFLAAGGVEDVFSYCRGDVIAGLAIKNIERGGNAAMGELEPLYLKNFVVRQNVNPVK